MDSRENLERCQRMLAQYPNNELARFSLGKALYDARAFVEAKEQFELALAAKPDWMVALILLGKCAMALGNHAVARGALERALRLAIDQNHEGPRVEVEELLGDLS
jgi:tetratricopeptide (TPR) repeat protein